MKKLEITKKETAIFQDQKTGLNKFNGWPLFLLFLFVFIAGSGNAQVPTLNYSSPQTYKQNTTITPLVPTQSGVQPFGYQQGAYDQVWYNYSIATSMVYDTKGNLFVVFYYQQNSVQEFPAGSTSGVNYNVSFQKVSAIAVDANDNLYVADVAANAVYKILPDRQTRIKLSTTIQSPNSIAVDASGAVYVTETYTGTLWKLPATGGAAVSLGTYPTGPEEIATDANNNIYLSNENTNSIIRIPAGGGGAVTLCSGLNKPKNMAIDPVGNVFFSDYSSIRMIPQGGGVSNFISADNYTPTYVALDKYGSLYVYDSGRPGMGEISPNGGYFISPNLPPGLAFDENTGIISGTPTLPCPATNYTITGYNATGHTSVTVSIAVSPVSDSHVAQLSQLKLSRGVMSPVFSLSATSYNATVVNGVRSLEITPATLSPLATIKINGNAVATGTSVPIPLNVGANAIRIVVTAPDGVTTKTYSVTVNRPGSKDGILTSLKRSAGILSPVFSPITTSYTSNVIFEVPSVKLTPTTEDPDAIIKINGAPVRSGSESSPIALNAGAVNPITVVVTSSDGTATKTYTLNITRAISDDAKLFELTASIEPLYWYGRFNGAYFVDVPYIDSTITLTPTTDVLGATVKINGIPIPFHTASAPIPLAIGSNTIYIVVTALDGVTTKTYTVTATRQDRSSLASLSDIIPSSGNITPNFSPNTLSYTCYQPFSENTFSGLIYATYSDATMTVNGILTTYNMPKIDVNVGSNIITILVAASDPSITRTYTINVIRAAKDGSSSPVLSTSDSVLPPAPATAEDAITVHQSLSPNGDGINDYLVIDGIQAYPDNKLTIMNRNGQLVFEAKGYDNSNRVFDGHSSKNGQMQLPGTYFYSLDYTVKGIIKHKTGYLVLKY